MNMWEYVVYQKPFTPFFLSLKVHRFRVSSTHNNAIHYEDKNILEVHKVSKQKFRITDRTIQQTHTTPQRWHPKTVDVVFTVDILTVRQLLTNYFGFLLPVSSRRIPVILFNLPIDVKCRSQWPRGLRSTSAAARLLRSWVRIPPGAWMFGCCECCVLSGRGLCNELIIRPEESYRLWCVVVCDLETSKMRRPWSALGRSAIEKKSTLNKLSKWEHS